jgi:hypothetical protein
MTLQPFTVLTSIVKKLCKAIDKDTIWRQFVVLANFRNKVEEFSTCLKAYFDLKGYTGDVITVVGTQYKEQNMCHAALFLNDTPDRSRPINNGVFDVIACLATHTIGTAVGIVVTSMTGCRRAFPPIFVWLTRRKGA